jgi:hypothetical protein
MFRASVSDSAVATILPQPYVVAVLALPGCPVRAGVHREQAARRERRPGLAVAGPVGPAVLWPGVVLTTRTSAAATDETSVSTATVGDVYELERMVKRFFVDQTSFGLGGFEVYSCAQIV